MLTSLQWIDIIQKPKAKGLSLSDLLFTESNPPIPAPVVGVRLPHFRLEIVSAAAKHPAATGKRRRQRFILPKVIIGDLSHIEEQARLEGSAPVLVEFPEDIDIEQLTHE